VDIARRVRPAIVEDAEAHCDENKSLRERPGPFRQRLAPLFGLAVEHAHADADGEGAHAAENAVVERDVEAVLAGEREDREPDDTCDDEAECAEPAATRQDHVDGKKKAEQELDADEPACTVPGEIGEDVPGLHQEQVGDESLPGDDGVILLLVDRHRAGGMRDRVQDDQQSENVKQHREVQWIKSRQPRDEKFTICAPLKELQRPSTIDIRQNESGEREEELDPEIAVADQEVEGLEVAVMMAFAIVVKHQDERRYGARARQCSNFARARGGHAHAADSSGKRSVMALTASARRCSCEPWTVTKASLRVSSSVRHCANIFARVAGSGK